MLLFSLGSNEFSQLSLSFEISQTNVPTQIGNFTDKNITKIACGWYHTLILINHTVLSFGRLENGALGRDENGQDILKIEGLDNIIDISCGESHSAALQKNGNLYVWGCFNNILRSNMYATDDCLAHKPRMIAQKVARIASCDNCVIIQKENCEIYYYGSLVHPDSYYTALSSESEMIRLQGAYKVYPIFDFIKASGGHFFGIKNDMIYAFGDNINDQLGDKRSYNLEVLDNKYISDVKSCDIGFLQFLFLNKQGDLYTGGYKLIHDEATDLKYEFYEFLTKFMEDVDLIYCIRDACLCVINDELYTWGPNRYGELGHEIGMIFEPTKVYFPFNRIIGIYAGEDHTIILTKEKPIDLHV